MKFKHVPAIGDKQAIIRVEGLEKATTLLHITDSHLNATDLRVGTDIFEESYRTYVFDELETKMHFERTLEYANRLQADCVVLTGDIVNGATQGNTDYLESRLSTLRSPYLYTFGNHDWEYPGKPWGGATRSEHHGAFRRLMQTDPFAQSVVAGGINLVAIDNSTYQVSEAQLAFMKEQLARGLPTLLFMHIPIYVPSLLEDVMKKWHAPIMMAAECWDEEARRRWMVGETEPSTAEFFRLLNDNPHENLIGVFCGHVHFPHRDAFGRGSVQYVTKHGFEGGYRVIRLLPWE